MKGGQLFFRIVYILLFEITLCHLSTVKIGYKGNGYKGIN
jgi:hypothetical protein